MSRLILCATVATLLIVPASIARSEKAKVESRPHKHIGAVKYEDAKTQQKSTSRKPSPTNQNKK
jgi:hypothetical protein